MTSEQPATYRLECVHEDVSGPCWARSPRVSDPRALDVWAAKHARETCGAHVRFDELVRRPRTIRAPKV
ncbi:hypothetical protein AB0B21_10925 [Streptomyces rimosus]|uniref:DUF7848 domain-containing protein n=1 Tax=Streptomyces TaxID=1883 RepID=UPI0005185E8E|nr:MULTISPECIES: hypothetical protein [Streptomyces]RSO12219.1 hypothetical protein DMH18_06920 [Streptomyces sp. WAC 06783]